MRQRQYTAAYSAFLLAKSLGASGMSDKMQNAQQKNSKQLQDNAVQLRANSVRLAFQAGLQQARNIADTNLTQSLRLLEFLRNTYDSTSRNEAAVLRIISEVVANSEQGLYQTNRTRRLSSNEFASENDTVRSDSLPQKLQQQVDSVFRQLTVPPYQPIKGFQASLPIGKKEPGGYHFIAAHHLLFTYYTYFYYDTNSEEKRDSSNSVILWRTDGDHLIPIHTFINQFDNLPRLSSDGQILALQLKLNKGGATVKIDSIYQVTDTELIGLKGFTDQGSIWFSPDNHYIVIHGGGRKGLNIIWRKVNSDLYYMLSISGSPLSTRFAGEQITMDMLNEADPYSTTSLTIDLKTQQLILPPACHYRTKATNVFFVGDNYLMVQHLADKPHIVLYSIQDWWLAQCETIFWGDFRTGSMASNGRYVVLRPRDSAKPAELWESDRFGHFNRVSGLSESFENAIFSPDSRMALFSDKKRSGQLRMLDNTGFRVIHTFTERFKATDCQFSPNSKWLFVDFFGSAIDSLWQVRSEGLGPAKETISFEPTITARFHPNSQQLVTLTGGNNMIKYYELGADGLVSNLYDPTQLPAANTLYIIGDQIVYSSTDTYSTNRTQQDQDGTLITNKLSKGALESPVYDDGETLFFVVYSELSRQRTLVGYDKILRETVLSRPVNGAFDLTMTDDKNIRLADPTGLYTVIPPRKILRLLQSGKVAPLTDELRRKFEPIQP
ncbi:WD40 repeat domain-containing protein [Spirosoma endbachense]|uniref:WD40 repeat domain-containing protein n=1 Tax=Spirosoma endbachense TaxID=2666025 RepID=A0A6P1W724_9BACT|nr:WD40 repeat domain-containing protein [Spirosoma endbachense]QHV99516.1 hypothetical protein GJR95_32890 [Spirosoma endbachense]